MPKKSQGVTLIELLTAIVVIAILVSIAVPSYRRYLLRSQRADATTALLRIQSAEEKYLIQHGRYTQQLDLPKNAGGLGLQHVSDQGFYDLRVQLTAMGYVATATAIAGKGQVDDTFCRTFSINDTGVRKALDRSGSERTSDCWR